MLQFGKHSLHSCKREFSGCLLQPEWEEGEDLTSLVLLSLETRSHTLSQCSQSPASHRGFSLSNVEFLKGARVLLVKQTPLLGRVEHSTWA